MFYGGSVPWLGIGKLNVGAHVMCGFEMYITFVLFFGRRALEVHACLSFTVLLEVCSITLGGVSFRFTNLFGTYNGVWIGFRIGFLNID